MTSHSAALERDRVQARLTARFPDLPAGLVIATVELVRRPRRRTAQPPEDLTWPQVEAAAEERLLLLHAALRGAPPAGPAR